MLRCLGSFSVVRCISHLKKHPGWGPTLYSVVRHLMVQPLYCSAANASVWGKRGYSDGSTPTHDSAVLPCFQVCPAFLHSHLPPHSPLSRPFDPSLHSHLPPQSPLSHPLDPSLHSQQQPLSGDCSTIPKLQLQPLQLPGGPCPCLGYVWLWQGLSDSHSKHLGGHRLAVSLSALNVSPLTQTFALMWGLEPWFRSSTC